MRFVSWNVNGLRACMQKGFLDFFHAVNADFFCLQETKLQDGQIALELPGYEQYWCYAEKKGYSGTAIFTKHTPLSVSYGLGIPDLDTEGRLITLEYPEFYLVTCYTPNAQRGLARINHRLKWEAAFRMYLSGLDSKKPVILCGDLNVAHKEIDLKNPSSNRGSAGFSDEERDAFSKLLDCGFTDSFRYLHPDATGAYTWWSYMFNARQNNAGWRIDYFVVSDRLKEQIYATPIYSDILGSDHCPVGLDVDISCNGSIWPSFENPDTPKTAQENDEKKSSGIKAAAALLSAALVLLGLFLFPWNQNAPPLPTTDPTISIEVVPPNSSQELFTCSVFHKKLEYIVTPTGLSSILGLSGFLNGTERIQTDPLSLSQSPDDLNFWIHIKATTEVDPNRHYLTLSYSSELSSDHQQLEAMKPPYILYAKTYDTSNTFNGWIVTGQIQRDTNITVDLCDGSRILQRACIPVWPLLSQEDAQRMNTSDLVDYALHLEVLKHGMQIDGLDAKVELFYNLWKHYPALIALSFREDAIYEIQQHTTEYPSCASTARQLEELINAHKRKIASYGFYISEAEANNMTTQELAAYLCDHPEFSTYLSDFLSILNMPYDVYNIAKYFIPGISVFEQRDDAIQVLLDLFGTKTTAIFLIVQPAYMERLSLAQAQQFLEKLSQGNGIESVSTDNLAMVITSVFHVYSSLRLSTPYNYAQLRLVFPPLQELEKRGDAHTVLLASLTESTGLVTDMQKATANRLLYLEPFHSRLNDAELLILNRGGQILYGGITIPHQADSPSTP